MSGTRTEAACLAASMADLLNITPGKPEPITRFQAWRAPFVDEKMRRTPFMRYEAGPIDLSGCSDLKEATSVAAAHCAHKDGLVLVEFDSKLGHSLVHNFTIKKKSAPIRWDWDKHSLRNVPVYKCYAALLFTIGYRGEFTPREPWRLSRATDYVGTDSDQPASGRLIEALP